MRAGRSSAHEFPAKGLRCWRPDSGAPAVLPRAIAAATEALARHDVNQMTAPARPSDNSSISSHPPREDYVQDAQRSQDQADDSVHRKKRQPHLRQIRGLYNAMLDQKQQPRQPHARKVERPQRWMRCPPQGYQHAERKQMRRPSHPQRSRNAELRRNRKQSLRDIARIILTRVDDVEPRRP